MTWSEFIASLHLDNPADRKDCGGYVLGALTGQRRSKDTVVARSAVALDADRASSAFVADSAAVLGCAMALYTTWSHTPKKPRWRLLAPLSRDVTPGEYRLIAQALMVELGWEQFDPGSTQPERLMHRPSTQGDYQHRVIPGDALDADSWLARAKELGLTVEPEPEPYTDTSPARCATDGVHPYAAAGIKAELARLDALPHPWQGGDHWDGTTFAVACNLVEFANSNWSGYSLADAERDLFAHAPADEQWGHKEHSAKWASALNKVGQGGRRHPSGEAADDFAASLDGFFDATPTLAHIRQAAHSRMVSAPALLAYVLARVLVEVPAGINLPAVIGGPAPLNLGVAVVGESGSGKSAQLAVSREVIGVTGACQEGIERNVGSGEGLVQTFLRWDRPTQQNVLIDDPRRILTVDEVDSLGAVQGRNGSTVAPTIRTAVSGGPLGQENATAERKRHVRAGSYRLVLMIGVQPSRSAVLLNDDKAGTPQRLVWVKATDSTLPDEPVEWPGTLDWALPDGLPEVLDYPDHVKAEVRAARRRQVKEGADANEGHLLLTRLKVGAALALLHGEVAITEQWWGLAGQMVAASMQVQADCRRVMAEETVQQRRNAGRLDGIRQQGALEYRDELTVKAAVAIGKQIDKHSTGVKGSNQRHEPDEGCTTRCFTNALRHFADRYEVRDKAVQHAAESDWVVQRGERWYPGESRPA